MKAFLVYFLILCIGYSLDFTTFIILSSYTFNIYLSNVLAFIFGTTINLILIKRFLFRDARYSFFHDWILTLSTNGIIGLGFGTVLIYIFYEIFFVSAVIAKIISSLITLILNYLIRIYFFNK